MKSLVVKEEKKAYIDVSDYDFFTIDRLCGVSSDAQRILAAMDKNDLKLLFGENDLGSISKDNLKIFSNTLERFILLVCSNDNLIAK